MPLEPNSIDYDEMIGALRDVGSELKDTTREYQAIELGAEALLYIVQNRLTESFQLYLMENLLTGRQLPAIESAREPLIEAPSETAEPMAREPEPHPTTPASRKHLLQRLRTRLRGQPLGPN